MIATSITHSSILCWTSQDRNGCKKVLNTSIPTLSLSPPLTLILTIQSTGLLGKFEKTQSVAPPAEKPLRSEMYQFRI